MPLILTAYCCGTWFDSSSGDLIADLHRRTATDATHWKAIFAGPGSGHIQNKFYNPLSGEDISGQSKLLTYGKAFLVPQESSQVSSTVQQGLQTILAKKFGIPYFVSAGLVQLARTGGNIGLGLAFGDGMALNVKFLLRWVAEAMRRGAVVLNLVGWSRGAVTCHLMANAVFKVHGDRSPDINIFAIDPVPGDANVNVFNPRQYFDPDYTRLPPCVRQYRSIIMSNNKRGFMPVIPLPIGGLGGRYITADYDVLYVPGDHGTACVPATPWEIATPGTVLLTNWLIENFLLGNGTEFTAIIRRTKIATALSIDRARRMGNNNGTRSVWFMVRSMPLPLARRLLAALHPSGREWFSRLMDELMNDYRHIAVI